MDGTGKCGGHRSDCWGLRSLLEELIYTIDRELEGRWHGGGVSEESQSLRGRGQCLLYFWRVREGSQQESATRLSGPQVGRGGRWDIGCGIL